MVEKTKKKFRLSLSTNILIGMVLGILCGILLGEYCAPLQIFGDAFIKLLQMAILPFIVVSLISGIGRLSFDEAKVLGIKAGLWLLVFWGIAFAVVLIMPLAYPTLESASFFSTSLVEAKKEIDFLDLFIPANPFGSLAKNVIPASVLFSLSVGIALIGIKGKQVFIDPLSVLSAALARVATFVVYLTPVGVFAIAASAAGTMTVEEFGRLQAYFATFIIATILLSFWILPMLVMAFTPFRYKDVVGLSKDALVTGFTTGNLFIILPVLIQNCKDLLQKYKLEHEDSDTYIDVLVPVSFNFPNIGKLLTLLFVLFAGWFYGKSFSLTDYPNFVIAGLFSFFGGVDVALPFMLDTMQIPSDAFQLYMVTGIINGRFATLLAAMNLLVFTLLVTCAITGFLSINWRKLLTYTAITVVLMAGVVFGTRATLSRSLGGAYTQDEVLVKMHSLANPLPVKVYKSALPSPLVHDPQKSRLDEISERGFIRVGYFKDALPFAFINTQDQLVGFDVEMAHKLARELNVALEFVLLDRKKIAEQLNAGYCDIVMSGFAVTTDRLQEMAFSAPYLDITMAFIVQDHRRAEFSSREAVQSLEAPKIGIPNIPYYVSMLREYLPKAKLVLLNSPRPFFKRTGKGKDLDALAFSAEAGSAWSLLYPDYAVVIPQPDVKAVPLAYPMARGDRDMVDFINAWIALKKKDDTIETVYNHWILGHGAIKKEPRWSIIRDVLHWVD